MMKNRRIAWLIAVSLTLLVLLLPICCFATDSEDTVWHGDLSGDEKIDLIDIVTFRAMIAEGDIQMPSLSDGYESADSDGNGIIDMRDLVLLRQYLAKYDYDAQKSAVNLGENKPLYIYTAGDGAVTSHYANADESKYSDYIKFYSENGYSEYCSNKIGELESVTYTKETSVHTVTFNKSLKEVYVTRAATGAEVLPEVGGTYTVKNATTVTQHYSDQINGMCYFVRLADGSFLVYDGGYATDASDAYATLCRLNGSANGIRIRAWIITHSHDDHYGMFREFSKQYASAVTLDRLFYSSVNAGVANYNNYLNSEVKTDIARFSGAKLCSVRTGMSFKFADVTLDVLVTPEQVYKVGDTGDFNETSIVTRVKNADGSIMFLGDCGVNVCNWLVDTYGDALKSDMVQVSHHGCETATSEVYDKISAPVVFWPCNENLMNTYRGELVKQHILEASYSKEHILHGYGTATRALSYKSDIAYLDILPDSTSAISGSAHTSNVRIENGVLNYEVAGEGTDPYVYFSVGNFDATRYNAIKLVVGADSGTGSIFFKTASDSSFSSAKQKLFSGQGTCDDGKMTVIVYFGNVDGYSGKISTVRIDMGTTVGETVEIYSAEAYYVDVD